MGRRMCTSRPALDRPLDPANDLFEIAVRHRGDAFRTI
jgi:hypothetical protein